VGPVDGAREGVGVVSRSARRRAGAVVGAPGGVGGERLPAGRLVDTRGSRTGRVGAVSVRSDGVSLARGGVPQIQRARILSALVEVARERGAGQVTVAHIVTRSGVSRRTFYEMFEDRDACFRAAFQDAVQRAAVRVVPAFRGAETEGSAGAVAVAGGSRRAAAPGTGSGRRVSGGVWRGRVRAGLLALLEFLDDEPGLGGLCVVDTLGAGPVALEARADVVAVLVDAVDEGRWEAKAGLTPTRLTAEGIVGGVLGVLYARLAAPWQPGTAGSGRAAVDPSKPLVGLLSALMGMIVLPYLGPAAAARESALPAPRVRRRRVQHVRSNPLEGLGMRLTYRTVCVLGAIAKTPDASNRQVANAAGIHDQGQMSRLLARLEDLGLVQNSSAGAVRGEPNAWRLTPRGRDVQHTISEQTKPPAATRKWS
jgi:AcrR family transcriptional regulator